MQPSFFIPHGGGPCFFMDWPEPNPWRGMEHFLQHFLQGLETAPKALLVVTAHWESDVVTVSTKARPGLYYDYYGFPPHTYELSWPAHGDVALAERALGLLGAAGIAAQADDARDYDHGVFVPLKVALPAPEIPVVQMSVLADLDPEAHLAAGRALAPLRQEGVVIIGSGLSYHNLQGFMQPGGQDAARAFDDWLTAAVEGDPQSRDGLLAGWTDAPHARDVHPREEHLAPIWVAAGAASGLAGQRIYAEEVFGKAVSAFRFG